jgi:HAD superfamily hydrolase (TIGR01509 family)
MAVEMSHTGQEPRIQAVVFDLDGLMFNSEDIFHEVGQTTLRRRGKELTQELHSQMLGRRAPEAMQICIEYHSLSDTVDDLLQETRELFEQLSELHLAPMPGLHRLLDHIEDHALPKGVATSSGRRYLEGMLTRFQLQDRFDLTLTAEDVTHGKPNPEIYQKAAERLGIPTAEMLVLEDSHAGTTSAVMAGAVAVSIPNRHSRHLDFGHAHRVLSQLDDPILLRYVSGSSRKLPGRLP